MHSNGCSHDLAAPPVVHKGPVSACPEHLVGSAADQPGSLSGLSGAGGTRTPAVLRELVQCPLLARSATRLLPFEREADGVAASATLEGASDPRLAFERLVSAAFE